VSAGAGFPGAGPSAGPLGPRPGRLWSLWDMRILDASGLFLVVRNMAIYGTKNQDDAQKIDSEWAKRNADAFASYVETLTALGLSGAKVSLERFIAKLRTDGITWGDLIDCSNETTGRLIDEMKDKKVMALTPREIALYNDPRHGWNLSIERFPQILDDVEEATKCFALSRYPAAVFHSIQAIEIGLIELGTFLKVQDPQSGWTAIAGGLQKVIDKKYKDRTRFERANFPFLEQMQGLVHGLKNAWRNKISHAHGRLVLISKEFSPEVAEEILLASRAFMRRLAEELPPAKVKKDAKK
jgi:hypothetical protein